MTKISIWSLLIMAVLSAECGGNGDLTAMRQADRDFILKASEANLAEIEQAKLAEAKTQNPAVRNFAELMIADHQAAIDELEIIAEDKNTAIAISVNFEHQEINRKLSEMGGYTFDTAYMHSQIKDHEKTIAIFETQISNGNDGRVVDYANKYLTHIQNHLSKADSISFLLNP